MEFQISKHESCIYGISWDLLGVYNLPKIENPLGWWNLTTRLPDSGLARVKLNIFHLCLRTSSSAVQYAIIMAILSTVYSKVLICNASTLSQASKQKFPSRTESIIIKSQSGPQTANCLIYSLVSDKH